MKGGKRPGAGRPKGSKNKTNEKIREHFEKLLVDNLKKMQDDLDKLDHNQRLQYMALLGKYVLPTMKAIEVTANLESPEVDMTEWK
ncbi:MAG: hypothetical protein ABJO28_08780 [Maribacter dokdonensis]|uniref:hypothetical protein n=1 Tax=Maribacter dokdonensis TaxID=320912 RepID=UPI0032999642